MQSNLYILVADLLSFLSMKSPNDSDTLQPRTSEQFNQMLNWFWEGLSCLCLEHVKSINEKVIYSFSSFLCWLLLSLFYSMVWKGEWNYNYYFSRHFYWALCIVWFSFLYVGVTRCHNYSASVQLKNFLCGMQAKRQMSCQYVGTVLSIP